MKRITYQISRPSAFSQIMVPSHDTVKWLEKGCRERASCAGRRENFARIFHISGPPLHQRIAPDRRLSWSRWKNSLTLAKDRWKYQGGNYRVSINALKNKQELYRYLTHSLGSNFSAMNFGLDRPEYFGRRWAHITYHTNKYHSYLDIW